MRTATTLISGVLLLGVLACCAYNPPPEVDMVAPPNNTFEITEPIVLQFSEPIEPESLEIRIWPGARDLFDIERDRLAGVEPIIPSCTLATSPCGDNGGVELILESPDLVHINVAEDALGDYGVPLQLEVFGTIEDKDGRTKNVSTFFDFQVVRERWEPGVDGGSTITGDVGDIEPFDIPNGPYLFFAEFNLEGMELAQQFFGSMAIDPATGDFLFLLVDADPKPGAISNTQDPTELMMDWGMEGFLFSAWGRVTRTDTGLEYETAPVTLAQNIAGISFELQDIVLRGRVEQNEETGLWQWDGTMATAGVLLTTSITEKQYDPQFANIALRELPPEHVPEGNPDICDATICERCEGGCDLPPDSPWPPPQYCE